MISCISSSKSRSIEDTAFSSSLFYANRDAIKQRRATSSMSISNGRKANLSAARKQRIKLLSYGDQNRGDGRISEFLCHQSGIEAMLNTSALESYHYVDINTYKCVLPKFQLLNFEAAPIMDLRVTPTNHDCTVEMLSCKFEGSTLVESQNNYFSASMKNHITWDTVDSDLFLEVDVNLNLTLEIYTPPFTLLPTSAIEGPGNVVIQAVVDRLVPVLLKRLVKDYGLWASQQHASL